MSENSKEDNNSKINNILVEYVKPNHEYSDIDNRFNSVKERSNKQIEEHKFLFKRSQEFNFWNEDETFIKERAAMK